MISRAMILRGGRIVDPLNGVDEVADIAIADGVIVPAEEVIDADIYDLRGKVVAPGFIDLHVHLRTPGQTHKETIRTGTRAAAAGGFTTIVAMPNTTPPIDRPQRLRELVELNGKKGVIRVLQTAALTLERGGNELTDAAALKEAGAAALTDDGSCTQHAELMLQALKQARTAGIPVIEHCEDETVSGGGAMNAGPCADHLGYSGQSSAAEELIVSRDALLARKINSSIHVQHVSSAGSVERIRQARRQGALVSAEATPHHISLTERACAEYGTNAKMNPPLRTEEDRLALIQGLCDDTISCIATDHAPHTVAEKAALFNEAPFGIIGLEAAVPICLTTLYHGGILSLAQLVSKFTSGPRQVLRRALGSLEAGAKADMTILDLDRELTLRVDTFHSLARNCPYDGWQCRGKSVAVIVDGCWVYSELPDVQGRF